jgi:NAD(P) transhydrogenase
MVVVGGGPVGCEYASVFTALGVEVTVLDMADRLLPFVDAEISDVLATTFTASGMRLILGSGVGAVQRQGGELLVMLADRNHIRPEKVLFAAGRAGNTEVLGLEEAGVATDDRGRIVVDNTYRTAVEGIYAAGDVIGRPALASVSMEQGRVAACHAFGIPFKETLDPLPPYGVYSIPEAAMVGLTEAEASERGIDYEVGRGWFKHSPRAQIAGSPEGLIKLVFRRDDRRLLGVHIVGEIAAELVPARIESCGHDEPRGRDLGVVAADRPPARLERGHEARRHLRLGRGGVKAAGGRRVVARGHAGSPPLRLCVRGLGH